MRPGYKDAVAVAVAVVGSSCIAVVVAAVVSMLALSSFCSCMVSFLCCCWLLKSLMLMWVRMSCVLSLVVEDNQRS